MMYIIAQDRGAAGRWYLSTSGRWTRLRKDAVILDRVFVAGLYNPKEHVLLQLNK